MSAKARQSNIGNFGLFTHPVVPCVVVVVFVSSNRFHRDQLPSERHFDQFLLPWSKDDKINHLANWSLHFTNGRINRFAFHIRVSDTSDHITGQNASVVRGCSWSRAHDDQTVVTNVHLNSNAAKFLTQHAIKASSFFGRHKAAVLVKFRNHAINRCFYKQTPINVSHIVCFNLLKRVDKQRHEFVVCQFLYRWLSRFFFGGSSLRICLLTRCGSHVRQKADQ